MNALKCASYIFSLVSGRILTITNEGKPIAVQQLDALLGKIDVMAGELKRISIGVLSLSPKRAINVQSLDKATIFATGLASELRKLIDLVRDSTFPAANLALAGKAGKKTPKKSTFEDLDRLFIPKKLLQRFCENVDAIFEKPERECSSSSPKNGFAILVNDDAVNNSSDSESDEEQFDEQVAVEEAIEKRSNAQSTFSRFQAEALNSKPSGASDSYDSLIDESPDTQDREFINDSKQSRPSDHRALYAMQAFKDAGLKPLKVTPSKQKHNSPAKRSIGDLPVTWCDKGHRVNITYKVSHDNHKKKVHSERVICEHCTKTLTSKDQAFTCSCFTKVVCVLCIQARASFQPPPNCSACQEEMISTKNLKKEMLCAGCNKPIGMRMIAWQCPSKSCNNTACEGCTPAPSMTKFSLPLQAIAQAVPPLPSPSPSSNVATAPSSTDSSAGLQAPMPGQPRA